MTVETIVEALAKIDISPARIDEYKGGWQIMCYNKRSAGLIRKLKKAGYKYVIGYDGRGSRIVEGQLEYCWIATASFSVEEEKDN